MRRKSEGFTLIEVLATVIILAIILSISFGVYNGLIKRSKEKTVTISKENILKAAELYSKETTDTNSWWGYVSDEKNYKYVCVTIQDLINNGYFGDDFVDKIVTNEDESISNNTLIKVVKDQNNMTIIKTEISTENTLDGCNQSLKDTIDDSEVDSYTLTYHFNDDKNTVSIDTFVIGADEPYHLKKPTYDGYSFLGWYTSKYGGSKIGDADDLYEPAYNINLYAHWNANKKAVRIKLNMNGGTLSSDKAEEVSSNEDGYILINDNEILHTIIHGQKIGEDGIYNYNNPSYINIINPGYSTPNGKEWCTKENDIIKDCYNQKTRYTSKEFCTDTSKDCDVTLYVNWQSETFIITLNNKKATTAGTGQIYLEYAYRWFLDAEKTKWMKQKSASGTKNPITIPVKTGYKFNGYYTEESGAGTQIIDSEGYIIASKTKTFTDDGTLYAYWTPNVYTITLNNKGATTAGTTKIYLKYNDGWYSDAEATNKITKITSPAKNGYLYDGYYKEETGGENPLIDDGGNIVSGKTKAFTANATLYAYWTTNNYKIIYNANGGTGTTASTSCGYNVDCTLRANSFKKTGYTFDGWYTAASGGTKKAPGTKIKITANTTMYAHWIANKYRVTYSGDGGLIRIDGNSSNLMASYSALNNAGTGHSSSTTKWIDISGRKVHGTVNKGTWGANYLSFNGSTSYVKLGALNSNKQTILVTFQTTSPSTKQFILGNWETGGGGIYLNGSKICGEYYVDGAWRIIKGKNTIEANKTYTAVLTYSGSTVALYIDGELQDSISVSGTIKAPKSSTLMFMGCNPAGDSCSSDYFNGKIYEAAVISAAVTAARAKTCSGLEVTYDAKYTNLPTPTRNGYNFEGWYTAASGGTKITADSKVATAGDHVLYARWSPFIPNGFYLVVPTKSNTFALHVLNVKVDNGSTVKIYKKATTEVGIKAQTTKVTNIGDGSITIINKHSRKAIEIKGGTMANGTDIQIYTSNSTLSQMWFPNPNSDGYILESAKDRTYVMDVTDNDFANGTNVQLKKSATSNGQIFSFVAVTAYKGNSYTIKYNANGGSGTIANQAVSKWEDDVKLAENTFTRTNYSFDSWNSEANGSGIKYSAGGTYSGLTHTAGGTFNLYAQWKDVKKPTCTTTKSNKGTTSGVTVTVKCSDAGDGCTQSTYTYTKVKSSKTYTVTDKAGNTGTCSVSVSSKKETRYQTRSCSTAARCSSAGCATWGSWQNYTCYGNAPSYACSWASSHGDGKTVKYRCYAVHGCAAAEDSKSMVQKATCSTYNRSYDKCGCSTWGSYGSFSSWSEKSCTSTSTKLCESRTIYS